MTWTAWYVLMPAGCAVSLAYHWFRQWQWPKRTVDRHVNTALVDDFSRADSVTVSDNWVAWEAELDRPYNWQDDGL